MKKYILSALVIILSSLSLSLYAQSMDFSVADFTQYGKNTGEITIVEEDFELQLLSIINEASIRKIISADDLVHPSTLSYFESYLSSGGA